MTVRGLQESGNDFKLQSVAARGSSPVERSFEDVGHSGENGWVALMARKNKDAAGGLSSRLRVVLADDQTILRQGLRAILDAEPDLAVIGEASNMRDAIALSRRL